MQHKRQVGVRVGRARVGKGVFTRQHFREDSVIGEIRGELIDDPNYGSDYCMHIGDGYQLEPAAPFRFLNHSCDPNCRFDWINLASTEAIPHGKHVVLIAMRDIRPGEELTIEYNWPAVGAIPCRCQSPMCRGWIVDEDEVETLRELITGNKQGLVDPV
jgi:hypothetical protein